MIYLDSAATSFYKPASVQAAVLDAMNTMASPGRGTHRPALAAAECCYVCRERLAKLFHVGNPEKVVLTFNATHGLNIALRSLVRPGTRTLISGWEHNAVTRPLHAIGARIDVLNTALFDPGAFMREAERRIRQADVVVCTHVSNVFGYVLPIEALAALCRRFRKPLVVDASQSAGVLDLDFDALGAEFAAMPGHKGLLGPQGTGVLLCKNDASPVLYGGSGSESRLQSMPPFLPDRLEAGTHNVPGIAGLSAGVEYILRRGTESIRKAEEERLGLLADSLERAGGLRLFKASRPGVQCGVLSALPERMSCEALGEALGGNDVAVRTGLHCAPLAHGSAGTLDTGTVRFSVSPFNSLSQMEATGAICKKILENP